MPEYVRQHFVPVSYLRSFSVDSERRNRGSRVFKFSRAQREWMGPVRAERECYADDHYSAIERQEIERELQHVEDEYSTMSRFVYDNGFSSLTAEQRYNLVLTIMLLFARNPIHTNSGTGGEEKDRIRVRFPATATMLAPDHVGALHESATVEERLARQDAIESRWSLHEIRAPDECSFLTSDSPVVPVFMEGPGSRTMCLLMPFDPQALWVLADEDIRVECDLVSEDDVNRVNQLVAAQAIDAVYADAEIDTTSIEDGFDMQFDLQSVFSQNRWEFVPPQVIPFRFTNVAGDPSRPAPSKVTVAFNAPFNASDT